MCSPCEPNLNISTKVLSGHGLDPEIGAIRKGRYDIDTWVRLRKQGILSNGSYKNQQPYLSPAERLNQDVLEEIFYACLPADRNPCINIKDAPILLTHICSTWRNVALASPRLWSAIHIILPVFPPEKSAPVGSLANMMMSLRQRTMTQNEEEMRRTLIQRRTAVSTWFKRSGSCSLSISVSQAPRERKTLGLRGIMETERQLHKSFFTSALLPHFQLCQNINICLPQETLYDLFENVLTLKCLPILRSLRLSSLEVQRNYYPREHMMYLEWKHLAVFVASGLTTLCLNRVSITGTEIDSSIPLSAWELIEELSLDISHPHSSALDTIPAAETVYNVVHRCNSLKRLQLNLKNLDCLPQYPSVPYIILPELMALSLNISLASLQVIISTKQLRLPSLGILNIQISDSCGDESTTTHQNSMEILLHNFGGYLHTLGIRTSTSSMLNALSLLRLTPSLKRLMFFSRRIDFTGDSASSTESETSVTGNNNHIELYHDDRLIALLPVVT